jgi:hypothetical protein
LIPLKCIFFVQLLGATTSKSETHARYDFFLCTLGHAQVAKANAAMVGPGYARIGTATCPQCQWPSAACCSSNCRLHRHGRTRHVGPSRTYVEAKLMAVVFLPVGAAGDTFGGKDRAFGAGLPNQLEQTIEGFFFLRLIGCFVRWCTAMPSLHASSVCAVVVVDDDVSLLHYSMHYCY